MRRGDFNLLSWSGGFDGPWSSAAVDRYLEEQCDGLSLYGAGGWAPSDLSLLDDLPGLRYLDVNAKVADDTRAFAVSTLEKMTLATGSRKALPGLAQPHLRGLYIGDRKNLHVARDWPNLKYLQLVSWRRPNLDVLRGAASIESLRIEARRQRGTLEGIEDCVALTHLELINYSIDGSAPLRSCPALVDVRLHAARPTDAHAKIDFGDLVGPRTECVWISNASALAGADHLGSAQRLREVRLINCAMTPDLERHLGSLRTSVRVEVVDPR